MRTVGDILNIMPPPLHESETPHLVLSNVALGVEVEVGKAWQADAYKPIGWDVKDDGSLTGPGGRELVFRSPMNGRNAYAALCSIEDMFEELGHPDCCLDGSVHVHLDVTRLTPKQLQNLITISFMFEPLLMEAFCPKRIDNPFCKQVDGNYDLIRSSAYMISTLYNDNPLVGGTVSRYAATNLCSVPKFGSLEYRALASEWRREPILAWVNALLSMYKHATETEGSVVKVFERYDTPSACIREVFSSALPTTGVDVYRCVKRGIRNARTFHYMVEGIVQDAGKNQSMYNEVRPLDDLPRSTTFPPWPYTEEMSGELEEFTSAPVASEIGRFLNTGD